MSRDEVQETLMNLATEAYELREKMFGETIGVEVPLPIPRILPEHTVLPGALSERLRAP